MFLTCWRKVVCLRICVNLDRLGVVEGQPVHPFRGTMDTACLSWNGFACCSCRSFCGSVFAVRFLFSRIPFARTPGVIGVCSRTAFLGVTHICMSPPNTFKPVRMRSSSACGTPGIMLGSKANFLRGLVAKGSQHNLRRAYT